MARVEGGYAYAPTWPGRRGAVFVIAATPYVRMRFKRLFPGHSQARDGQIIITATRPNARDLAMFLSRHPLEPADEDSAVVVKTMAEEHERGEERVDLFRSGAVPDLSELGRQPAIQPRDYQLVVPAMVRAQGFLLLTDEMGLGKTFESSLIFLDPGALPGLVVAPKHLVDQWVDEELPKYYPWLLAHKVRKGTPYEVAKHRSCKGREPDVLVITYDMLYGWVDELEEKNIQTVIFDEGDALRTGGDTRKYSAAVQVARRARYRILATGTPVHNWGDEMWNLLDLLEEGILGTMGEFTHTWGGKHPTDPRAFGQFLQDQGYHLHRDRKDVGRELPEVSMMVHPVESDNELLRREMDGIIAMAVKVVDPNEHRDVRFTMSGQFEEKVRKATGVAKAPYVAAFVRLLLQTRSKVMLMGYHHDVYEIWRRELAEFDPVFFTGAQSPAQKAESKRRFCQGDARVFIMSLRSGSGLNGLQEVCDTIVFGEIDWTPPPHTQAICRINRDGQIGPIDAFFLMSDSGADPKMAETVELKKMVSEPLVDPGAELVQESSEAAASRVRALALDVLRRHGVAVPQLGEVFPEPVEGSGELIAASTIAARQHAAGRAQQTRILEGQIVVEEPDRVPANREGLRGRLTGAMRD
jgi:hypothetical protein